MIGEPIEVVVLGASAEVVEARLLWRSDGVIGIGSGRVLPIGASVCVRTPVGAEWLYGRIEASGENGTIVSVRGTHASDRREFSRSCGALRLRYRLANDVEAAAWMGGERLDEEWLRPDPFMDFSGSGLKFHHGPTVAAGDTVLLELSIGTSHRTHRLTGVVVRIAEIPADERDEVPWEDGASVPTHAIAVHFEDVAPATTEALVRFGERIQEAMI